MHLINKWMADHTTSSIYEVLRFVFGFLVFQRLLARFLPHSYGLHFSSFILSFIVIFCCIGMIFGIYARLSSFIAGVLCLLSYYNSYYGYLDLTLGANLISSYRLEITIYVIGTTCLILSLAQESSLFLKRGPSLQPSWPLYLLRFQFCAIYFWTAIAKIGTSFLSGEVFKVAYVINYLGSENSKLDFLPSSLLSLVAITVVAIEFFLVFGFFFKKTKKWAFFLTASLHLMALILLPVQIFTIIMLVSLIIFIPDSEFFKFLGRYKTTHQ